MKQDKIVGEAIILGVESVVAYREYEKKEEIFNQYLKRHSFK